MKDWILWASIWAGSLFMIALFLYASFTKDRAGHGDPFAPPDPNNRGWDFEEYDNDLPK